jgi:hypothetical protein
MRRLMAATVLLTVLVLAAAVPAFASDGDLLGSGAAAPHNGKVAHVPVTSVHTDVSTTAGHDMLAATGFDSGIALLVGLGLVAAGGAALATGRMRAHR